MDKETFLEELLSELSYRSDEGYPDLSKDTHIQLLSEIMDDWGLSDIKNQLITNLVTEQEDDNETQFQNPILNREIEYTDDEGNQKTGKVGNLLRQPKDTPPRVAAEKELRGLSDEEKAEIDNELGSQRGNRTDPDMDFGGKDDEDGEEVGQQGDGQGQEEQPNGTALDPTTSGGQDYIDSLPDNDPAKQSAKEKGTGGADLPNYIKPEYPQPEEGEVSDINDEFSDGETKQKALKYGIKNKKKFKPAPGNISSMTAEIMSGESYYHLRENPDMDIEELTKRLYEQIRGTELGKQLGAQKVSKKGKYKGYNRGTYQLMQTIAKSGKKKFERTQQGIQNLTEVGKLEEPVTTRSYYGHEASIQKQLDLISELDGPFYTREGVEVPSDELTEFIKNSGGGENPSDTATITVGKKGRAMVEFHSDKLTTKDIQANSTPNQESELFKTYIENSDMSEQAKQQSIEVISQGQKRLNSKEEELKNAANKPAQELANGDISKILEDIKSDKGITGRAKVSTKLSTLTSRGKPHISIRPYLPDQEEDYTEEQLLKAFYEFAGDGEAERDLTGGQLKLLYRSAKQQGYDISEILGKIREESLEIQRDTHRKLNERSITLPNGNSKPLGDYLEAKNVIEKLHIDVIDDDKESGVGKYDGLFDVNMGGTIVEDKQLKHCLKSKDTNDFISHFEVGTPESEDEVIRSKKTNEVTGRNVFVYAITEGGERIKVAYKTQRSKQGQSGKLNTTYQWDESVQKCFKKNQ